MVGRTTTQTLPLRSMATARAALLPTSIPTTTWSVIGGHHKDRKVARSSPAAGRQVPCQVEPRRDQRLRSSWSKPERMYRSRASILGLLAEGADDATLRGATCRRRPSPVGLCRRRCRAPPAAGSAISTASSATTVTNTISCFPPTAALRRVAVHTAAPQRSRSREMSMTPTEAAPPSRASAVETPMNRPMMAWSPGRKPPWRK